MQNIFASFSTSLLLDFFLPRVFLKALCSRKKKKEEEKEREREREREREIIVIPMVGAEQNFYAKYRNSKQHSCWLTDSVSTILCPS